MLFNAFATPNWEPSKLHTLHLTTSMASAATNREIFVSQSTASVCAGTKREQSKAEPNSATATN